MKQIFFHSKIKYILCFLYSLIIIVFYLATHGFNLIGFIDSTFIAGFSLICVGGLSVCAQLGAFDIFSYTFAKKGSGKNRLTFYDYQQLKQEKRKNAKYTSVPYFVIGVLFSLISFIVLNVVK